MRNDASRIDMVEEELKKEIEEEFKEHFPNLDVVKDNKQYQVFESILLTFLIPFKSNDMFIYMSERDGSKAISQHLADIPQGIEYFETWFNNELLVFAKEIVKAQKAALPDDKVYLSFAQFLDDRNIEKFIEKSKFTPEDEQVIRQTYEPFLQTQLFETFMQALSCVYAGLDNSASTLLKQWVQSLWFDGDDIQKQIDEAKKIVTTREIYSKAGKAGSKNRWNPKKDTEKFAIELSTKANYKNSNQAADAITSEVIKFGKSIGWNFSSDFQAQRTIYNWLRKHKKNTN